MGMRSHKVLDIWKRAINLIMAVLCCESLFSAGGDIWVGQPDKIGNFNSFEYC